MLMMKPGQYSVNREIKTVWAVNDETKSVWVVNDETKSVWYADDETRSILNVSDETRSVRDVNWPLQALTCGSPFLSSLPQFMSHPRKLTVKSTLWVGARQQGKLGLARKDSGPVVHLCTLSRNSARNFYLKFSFCCLFY